MLDGVQRSAKTTDGDGAGCGAANGKPGETLFSKAIPLRFREGMAIERGPKERAKGIRRISRKRQVSPRRNSSTPKIAPIATALSSRSARRDLIGLDRLTGLINRPITPIDEVSASRRGRSCFFGLFTPGCAEGYPFVRRRTVARLHS